MTVYVDVLIFINLYIDFLLLRVTARLTDTPLRFGRTLLGAAVGSVCSLWILLPQMHFLITGAVKLIMAAAITFVAFGRQKPTKYVRLTGVYYLSSYIFAGAMFGIWVSIKPGGMLINNSVVYFNISPLLLIATSAACYGVVWLIGTLSRRMFAPQPRSCRLNITYDGRAVEVCGLIDSGNCLRDAFSDKPIIIIDEGVSELLLGEQPVLTAGGHTPRGFRVIPYSVVGGGGLMPVFKPDKLTADLDGQNVALDGLIGISGEPLGDKYGAIVAATLIE